MSYNPSRNEDSLSELFSNIQDYIQIERKLIENRNNFDNFILWFEKAKKINCRNLSIFIRENYDIFDESIQKYLKTCRFIYKEKINKNEVI